MRREDDAPVLRGVLRRRWRRLDTERAGKLIEAGRLQGAADKLEADADRLLQEMTEIEVAIQAAGGRGFHRCRLCGRGVVAHGLCATHYDRRRRGAKVRKPVRRAIWRPRRRAKHRRAQRLRLCPANPVRLWGELPKDAQGRRGDCKDYAKCLDDAARENWDGFTCRFCTGAGGEAHGD